MMATAAPPRLRTVELVRFQPEIDRAGLLFRMLAEAARPAGLRLVQTATYQGGADLLVLWGPGHPSRFGPMRRQLKAGGHVLAFDLAYWDRLRKVRVSLDAAHPQQWVMQRDWSPARFTADQVVTGDVWDPAGPVLVAGIGDKAKVQYGAAVVEAWEAEMMQACRARGRAVVYRPKRGATMIDEALKGKSLVVTWHSNVAVDAIRWGIPVVCRDGAAAALYGPTLPADMMPVPVPTSVRNQFLANLAWFQWAPHELSLMWHWLGELLS